MEYITKIKIQDSLSTNHNALLDFQLFEICKNYTDENPNVCTTISLCSDHIKRLCYVLVESRNGQSCVAFKVDPSVRYTVRVSLWIRSCTL